MLKFKHTHIYVYKPVSGWSTWQNKYLTGVECLQDKRVVLPLCPKDFLLKFIWIFYLIISFLKTVYGKNPFHLWLHFSLLKAELIVRSQPQLKTKTKKICQVKFHTFLRREKMCLDAPQVTTLLLKDVWVVSNVWLRLCEHSSTGLSVTLFSPSYL